MQWNVICSLYKVTDDLLYEIHTLFRLLLPVGLRMQQPPSGETWALATISMQNQHLHISSFLGILVWDEGFYSSSGSFLHNVIDALNKGYKRQKQRELKIDSTWDTSMSREICSRRSQVL
ncbi:hypothetical protein V1478_004841 [Vespula squamosa]|uniref:Uncharacterized protein n=1 Tax=Vespula squamosa TaxID=30214 RepID=A0ABD2BEV7_VESSQ